MVVVFINEAVLLPKLYFCSAAAFGGGRGRAPRGRGFGTATLRYLLPLVTSLLGSSLLAVTRYANQQEREVIRAESEQLTTELKFLKSQVNPHFLFNTLNNIYTLTLLKDDQAPESLLRLSEMLRYMLYEAETATVALSREVNYIMSFVALKQLKDSRAPAADTLRRKRVQAQPVRRPRVRLRYDRPDDQR